MENQWRHHGYHAFLGVDPTAAPVAAVRGGLLIALRADMFAAEEVRDMVDIVPGKAMALDVVTANWTLTSMSTAQGAAATPLRSAGEATYGAWVRPWPGGPGYPAGSGNQGKDRAWPTRTPKADCMPYVPTRRGSERRRQTCCSGPMTTRHSGSGSHRTEMRPP